MEFKYKDIVISDVDLSYVSALGMPDTLYIFQTKHTQLFTTADDIARTLFKGKHKIEMFEYLIENEHIMLMGHMCENQ